MAPIRTNWKRLIRFVAAETARVHIGEPVDATLDVGVAAAQGQTIKAYEIIGSALDPNAEVTKRVLTVQQLLTPLTGEEIKVVRCLGLNYSDHAAEAKMALPKFPILFYKPTASLIGPLAPVTIPRVVQPPSEHLADYEVELVIVIGKTARDVPESEALDYVLAYTGANDISFRKHQLAVSQWGFSKSFDNTNPLGPCLVAASSIPEPQKVPLKCTLNGTVVQDGTTADQIFGVKQTIAFLSQGTTLAPGSIILTGTPKGVGFVKSPPLYIKHGDKMSVWVGKGIGTLVNNVVEEGKEKAKL
ncbi:hypothetical protein CYLTODRAFT_377316 [Cylindrobasidium torrendii FP15055 ss-10]|uniref:Fumarylacetoacetase-like C-terminal domain-containing protein n=1 Tax=Cylindrobasidium torrendii FP15055 ss-10 TaxID=1314674 RepID=A0A0D7BB08_9AGAR|nr:hypothetical protein CYLTODRAFT_377316 [Cylindrobasidium torrendii FP15055 ss-10]